MADAQIGRLIVALEANTTSLEDGAQRAQKRMDSFKGAVDAAKEALAALGAFEVFKGIIEQSAEAEKAQALLASQIKATGDASGYTVGQLEDLADGFSKSSTQSREEIERLESQLMAFRNVAGEQFKGAIQAALDFSAVTGRDATESVRALGLALNDPAQGIAKLTRAGIELDEATKHTVKDLAEQGNLLQAQNILLAAVERSYGGAAEAARNTLGGALAGLKHDFNDLLQVSDGPLQSLTDSVKALDKAITDPEVKQGLSYLVSAFVQLAAVGGKAVAYVANTFAGIGTGLAQLQGYTGNWDDQIKGLNGHIEQTKILLEEAQKSDPSGKSPAIAQMQEQLRQYQSQLILVQAQQQLLTGKGPTAALTYTAPSLDNFLQSAPNLQNKNIDVPVSLSQGNFAGLKSAYDQMVEDQKKVMDIWKQNDPKAFLQQQIEETKALIGTVADGQIFTAEDAAKHIQDLQKQYEEHTNEMTQFAEEAAHNIQDAFAQFLFHPFQGGLDGMLKSFGDMIQQMIAQMLAAQVLGDIFGSYGTNGQNNGFANFMGSVFAGHRAGGGPVSAGMLYQVNENGTEGFLPSSGGSVIPLGPGGGAGGGHIELTIHQQFNLQGADPAAAAQLLSALPAFKRSIYGAVDFRKARGRWPD